MPTSRNYLTWVPLLAFNALLLAGLAASCMTLLAIPAKDWASLSDPEKILSGESTRRFTRLLNQHFVLGRDFSRIEHGLLWNLTGDLGPRVRAGCGDWLFLTDELAIHRQRAESAGFRASLAAQLGKRLASRGIRLLVVVVPDKTRIEAAHLCGIRRPLSFANRIGGWLESLNSQGIRTLDLTPTLAGLHGERYYHTDTHWNEAGANAAAQAVKERLHGLGWVTAANGHAVALDTRLVERPGDLIRLAGLDGLPAFLRPGTELASRTEVAPVSVAGDDLFGDESLPSIALVGTSYSRNSNFVPLLEHHLGEPVANLAKDGGDFAGAATDYFDSPTFRDTPPKVIVWEVPERVIEMPVQDIERQWMEKLQSAGISGG